jgi:hypothetical protein
MADQAGPRWLLCACFPNWGWRMPRAPGPGFGLCVSTHRSLFGSVQLKCRDWWPGKGDPQQGRGLGSAPLPLTWVSHWQCAVLGKGPGLSIWAPSWTSCAMTASPRRSFPICKTEMVWLLPLTLGRWVRDVVSKRNFRIHRRRDQEVYYSSKAKEG